MKYSQGLYCFFYMLLVCLRGIALMAFFFLTFSVGFISVVVDSLLFLVHSIYLVSRRRRSLE